MVKPRFYKFRRHKMITEVILIDIDDPSLNDEEALEEAYFLFETEPDKYPVVEKIETINWSHMDITEVCFWQPELNNKTSNQ